MTGRTIRFLRFARQKCEELFAVLQLMGAKAQLNRFYLLTVYVWDRRDTG